MRETFMRIAGASKRRLPKKIPFSVRALEALTVPAGKDRAWAFDAKTPNLAYMLTATGSGAFYWYGRMDGRPVRYRLGGAEIGIENARKLSMDVAAQRAHGTNPHADRKKVRAAISFKDLFDLYLDRWAKLRNRDWRKDEQKYKKHLAAWASRPARSITGEDVAEVHNRIGKDRPGAANRVLALISSIYNRAPKYGLDVRNPAKGIERFDEHARDRYLTADELRRFFESLNKEPSQLWKDLFMVLLLTGARSGNVKSMRWDELNLADATWTIPGEKFKSGKPLQIPLPPAVVKILEARKGNKSKFVFPSYGKLGHVAEPKMKWEEICRRAKLTGVWIHDLRRTCGSWQAAGGSSLHVIGRSLGHTQQSTTAVYARINIDPIRQSINGAADAMLKAAKAKVTKRK